MKRIGLRRVLPRVSYAVRWWLVQCALYDRTMRRLTPEQRASMSFGTRYR